MGVKCDRDRQDRAGRASHTEPLWSRVKLGGADVMCGQNGTLRHRNGNTLHFHDDEIRRRIDLGMAFASKYTLFCSKYSVLHMFCEADTNLLNPKSWV